MRPTRSTGSRYTPPKREAGYQTGNSYKPAGNYSAAGAASYQANKPAQQSAVKRQKNRLMGNRVDRNERKAAGAKFSEINKQDKFKAWRRHHLEMAVDSLKRLLTNPFSSLMTWAVIAIALALPLGLFVFLNNAQLVSSNWDGNAQMSLYLHDRVSDNEGLALARELDFNSAIAETRYLSKEQALAEFKEFSGFGQALDYLDSNPLPAVIIVRPNHTQVASQEALVAQLQALPEVEEVQLDLAWVKRLYYIMELGQRTIVALGVLLSLAVLLVIGNTLRLAIENRRQEIIVVKLIGATDAFVRRPFLYTGIWYGLGGGILAWLLLYLSLYWLEGPVKSLASAYSSDFNLIGLDLGTSFFLLFSSVLLGWLGAWLAVGRHLTKVEPH